MLHEPPQPIRLKDYRPPEFLIDQVRLHFDLGEEETRVRSSLSMRRNPVVSGQNQGLYLHGEGLQLVSLTIDGRSLTASDYSLEAEGLTLHEVPDCFTLQSEVAIRPQENTALEGLYKSSGMFCTQC